MNVSSNLRSFIFIRHGETTANEMRVISGGDSEPSLTEFGRRQIYAAADTLKRISEVPDVIVCSVNNRSVESAEILRKKLGGDIIRDPLLNERKLGDWNNKDVSEVNPMMLAGETPRNGESRAEFRERFFRGLNRYHELLLNHRTIVVGSRGSARLLLEMADRENAAFFPNGNLLRISIVNSSQFELVDIENID